MAKADHSTDYFYMFEDEDFDVEYDFTNNMGTGETLSTCDITVYDSAGVEHASTMIANKSISSPDVTFTIQNPVAVDVYEIKLVGTSDTSRNYVGKITVEVIGDITLTTYIAGPASNSYCTLKEANNYIRSVRSHSSTWDTLSVVGKKYLLVEACKMIDNYNFIGKKYYDNQALQMPRDDHPKITGDVATPITTSSFKNTSFTSDTFGAYKSNTNYWKYGTIQFTNATWLGDIRNIDSNDITTDVVTVATTFPTIPTENTDFIAFEPLDTKIKNAQCYQALHILENNGNGTLQSYSSAGVERVKIGDVDVAFKQDSISRPSVSVKAKQLLSEWIERHIRLLRG